MDILFTIKHYANKTLLTFFGPADLDDHADPRVALRREYDIHKGKEPAAVSVSQPTALDGVTETAPAALPSGSRNAA